MFSTILGGLVVLAVVSAIIILTPTDSWELDSEIWYEQFGPHGRRDTFADELQIMRLEAEVAATSAAHKPAAAPRGATTLGGASRA